MSKVSKDDVYEVCDSTDWLETPLPCLAPVDSALRCQVCRDFYVTPMITSCSHTFCSRCIRDSLNNDGKCPTCREKDDASKLRNNYPVEELVDAFKRARPNIMEYAKRSGEAMLGGAPKRRRLDAEIEENSSPVRKRTRSGRRAQQSSQQIVVLDSEGDDENYVPGMFVASLRPSVTNVTSIEEAKSPRQVLCPICQDGFPTVQAVEAHVDHCDGEPPSKKQKVRSTQTSIPPQQISKPTKRPDRLPQLHYSMVKDNVLRKKLQEFGISAAGTRQLMERRYTEWVTLWNSNCDSRNPRGKAELKRELDVWERTQGAPIASRANPGGNIRDKDFDSAGWSSKHDDSFRQLIEEARRKRTAKAETSDGAPKPEGSSVPAVTTNVMLPPPPYSSPYGTNPATSTAPAETGPSKAELTVSDVPSRTLSQNGPESEIAPESPPGTSSQRRFFQESTVPAAFDPSSQAQNTQALDKDIGMSSDMSTIRPLQP